MARRPAATRLKWVRIPPASLPPATLQSCRLSGILSFRTRAVRFVRISASRCQLGGIMRRLFVLISLCFFVSALPAQDAPRKVATVEGVTEYRLANGARVLLFPEASRPTVTVNMTVLVGSRHEGYGETGMAHLLEHMVFKGTPTLPRRAQGAARPRGQLQRHHQRRPHQLLRDHARHRREPRVRHPARSATGSSTASSSARTWSRK